MFDTRIALAVRHDLESWQKLNGDLVGIALRAKRKLVDKILASLGLRE